MFLLLILEPISQGLMHPFVNQMLEEINVTPDRTKIGYYAGIINSLFALSQLCTSKFDKIHGPIFLSQLEFMSNSARLPKSLAT